MVWSRFLLVAVKRAQRNYKLHTLGLRGLIPPPVARAEEMLTGWTAPSSVTMFTHMLHAAKQQGVDLQAPIYFADCSSGTFIILLANLRLFLFVQAIELHFPSHPIGYLRGVLLDALDLTGEDIVTTSAGTVRVPMGVLVLQVKAVYMRHTVSTAACCAHRTLEYSTSP